MKQTKNQSGAARIVEVLLGQALLNCKVGTVNSLIEKVENVTGNKNMIGNSLNNWAVYLYEQMRWI